MSFVNAMVSEEDAQFELYGHFKIWWDGIWSAYYYTFALVEKAVKHYVEQSKQGRGPFSLFHCISSIYGISYDIRISCRLYDL